MLTVDVIAVGKIKESYLREAVSEYAKRLSRFCTLHIVEVPEAGDDHTTLRREGEWILPKLKGAVVPLCVEGKALSSEDLANWVRELSVGGQSRVTFVIGGSRGLSDRVKDAGVLKLSLSNMTLPHQLARVVLLEQIYRAFKIINGETYHK